MKCPSCGSNLTIDDEKCLFCGTDNPFAVKHRKEMRHFTKEFNETKEAVMEKSYHVNRWAVKVTLIAILVAANLAVLFFINNIYDFEDFFRERELKNNYAIHKEQLDKMEENRDYIAFACYWTDYNMYSCDVFDEFYLVSQACNSFSYLYQNTMDIVTKEESEYYSHEDRIEHVAEQIEYVYKYANKRDYVDEEQYKPQHQECLDDLVEDMEAFVQTYYGLTDEQIESFEELSKARRQILLEEGIKQYEQTE